MSPEDRITLLQERGYPFKVKEGETRHPAVRGWLYRITVECGDRTANWWDLPPISRQHRDWQLHRLITSMVAKLEIPEPGWDLSNRQNWLKVGPAPGMLRS